MDFGASVVYWNEFCGTQDQRLIQHPASALNATLIVLVLFSSSCGHCEQHLIAKVGFEEDDDFGYGFGKTNCVLLNHEKYETHTYNKKQITKANPPQNRPLGEGRGSKKPFQIYI
eukprot:700297-Hanusia_phi.AAC.1